MTKQDEPLVRRIRPLLKRRRGYSEKKMFGGVCFLINGNMCVGPWKGDLVVRLEKADHESTQSEPMTRPMDITGRVMKGWAVVDQRDIADDADLKAGVARAARYAASLPAKNLPAK